MSKSKRRALENSAGEKQEHSTTGGELWRANHPVGLAADAGPTHTQKHTPKNG
jgi:hypothetical protein